MFQQGRSAWAALLLGWSLAAHAAPPPETYGISLDPLIDRAAQHPNQFAVDVPKRVTVGGNGAWHTEGDRAVWEYALRIPGALTLGLHAAVLHLPADGTLRVAAGSQSVEYRAAELRRPELWTRPLRGDTLSISLSVPQAARAQATLEIAGFQAGYRSLGGGSPDHPHFRSIKAQTASSCVENYRCDASAATTPAANATVGLIISGQFYCSGTLLNDVPQDGKPYILTARHCENGDDGGGAPQAAAGVTVYWHATTACGQPLDSINNAGSPANYGGTTVVEQQDQWLIRMDAGPNFADAFFAGWDASGAPVNGGFTVQHSLGLAQQYTEWAGDAYTDPVAGAVLNVGYDSVFLATVNSLGSVDHGASGSGLFTAANQLVGSLSRARVNQCPASPPATPSGATAVALFTQLAATWTSTADTTSTTGAATLASVLDPAHTGVTTLDGNTAPPSVHLQSGGSTSQTGDSVTLYYQVANATGCTASGGLSGDGWNGSVTPTASGSRLVTESAAGAVTYTLTCSNGTRSATASATVTWSLSPPVLQFYPDMGNSYAGNPVTLYWQSNLSACTASGGLSGDGWSGSLPGTGNRAVTETRAGTVTYTLTCGSGAQQISQSVTVQYSVPTATVSLAPGTPAGLRAGEAVTLLWSGTGNCTFTGGAAGDGWNGAQTVGGGSAVTWVRESAAGTYTYTLTCGPAGVAATAHVSYTFTNDPPHATLTPGQASQLIDLQATTVPNLVSWTANLSPCSVDVAGPGESTRLIDGAGPTGSATQPEQIAGAYTYTLTCGTGATTATSTATVTWTQPTPHVTLTASSTPLPLSAASVVWNTNVLPCTGSGGTAGDGWNGPRAYTSGGLIGGGVMTQIHEPSAGTYNLTLTCGSGTTGVAHVTVTLSTPDAGQLNLAASNPLQGTQTGSVTTFYGAQPVHLSWNSSVGACTGYDGPGGDGWQAAHPAQGSVDLPTPASTGTVTYTYSLVCGTGSSALEAQVQVHVEPANFITIQRTLGTAPYFVGKPTTITWTSDEAARCTQSGGASGDGWGGTVPTIGSLTLVETGVANVSYTLTCTNGSASQTATFQMNWQAVPTITLTAPQTVTLGEGFGIAWLKTGDYGTCTASGEDGGAATGSWNGNLAGPNGSLSVVESSGSTHTYEASCKGHYGTITAQVAVNFTPAAASGGDGTGTGTGSGTGTGTGTGTGGGDGSGSTGGSGAGSTAGSSSKGGGGAFDLEWLALLAGLTAIARARGPRR